MWLIKFLLGFVVIWMISLLEMMWVFFVMELVILEFGFFSIGVDFFVMVDLFIEVIFFNIFLLVGIILLIEMIIRLFFCRWVELIIFRELLVKICWV